MVIRYVRQRNDSSCGPIAILNAMKWFNPNESFTYNKYYKWLKKETKCDNDGIYSEDMYRTLQIAGQQYNFRVEQLETFDNSLILNHLHNNGSAIIGHLELPQEGVDDQEGHYSFWNGSGGCNVITGVNVLRKPKATKNIWLDSIITYLHQNTIQNNEAFEIYLMTKV